MTTRPRRRVSRDTLQPIKARGVRIPALPSRVVSNERQTNVLIVGGGPVGIELAVALQQAGVDYVHLEAQQVGHTMTWWAPGTRWFSSNERISLAGVPLVTPDQTKATREQYLAYLRQLVMQFDLKINAFEPVTDIARRDDGFVVTSTRATYSAKHVVLAVGGTDHPRALGVEGEDLDHVDGYFREPHVYFGRRVLVIGGKNSAVEAALRAHHAGAQVAFSYRRAKLREESIKYWLLPEFNGLCKAERIEAFFDTIPVAITPEHVTLERRIAGQAPERFDIAAEAVLKLIGYEQDKTLFHRAGVELTGEEQKPIYDEETMQTNVPGLYVAGTAVGGTQHKFSVFLENCHVHVDRIVGSVTGRGPVIPKMQRMTPEMINLQPES